MDELKINFGDGVTRGLLSKLVTKILRKKLGIDSLTLHIHTLNGGIKASNDGNKNDDLVLRADVTLSVSKDEIIDKIKDGLL